MPERLNLTKTAIGSMPFVPSGERMVYDATVPQLAVRIRASKKVYVLSFYDKSRAARINRTIGDVALFTPEQARKQAMQIMGQAAEGEDVRRKKLVGLTVNQLLQQWHDANHKNVRTADEIKASVTRHMGKLLSKTADAIKRDDITRIHRWVANQGQRTVIKNVDGELKEVLVGEKGRPATADKFSAYVRTIYQWGCDQGLCETNPATGISKAYANRENGRTRYLHGDELLRFWQALEADRDADTRDVIWMLLYTGQRRGNVLQMRWQDIDLEAGIWTIGAEQTKQRSVQSTPLVQQAQDILIRRYQAAATQWVFPATRSADDGSLPAMSEARLRKAWGRILKASGIDDLRVHDLRHTSGSWLARLGTDVAIRQKALGHKTPSMAARYSHLELDPVADAMQRVANAIKTAATSSKPKRKSMGAQHG